VYYFNKAVQLRPYDGRIWFALGQCLCELKRFDEACRAYGRAARTRYPEPTALLRLGKLCETLGKREEAATVYEQWLRRLISEHSNANESMDRGMGNHITNNNDGIVVDDFFEASMDLPCSEVLARLGANSNDVATTLGYLSNFFRQEGHLQRAEQYALRWTECGIGHHAEARSLLRDIREELGRLHSLRSKSRDIATPNAPGSALFHNVSVDMSHRTPMQNTSVSTPAADAEEDMDEDMDFD
jgi:tetratricopeptide (TPR) repeat protein